MQFCNFFYRNNIEDLWSYTSDSKIYQPLEGTYALESVAYAHKFLRLSPHKTTTKG